MLKRTGRIYARYPAYECGDGGVSSDDASCGGGGGGAALPAVVGAVRPGGAQSQRLKWRETERQRREIAEAAAAEEGSAARGSGLEN